MFVPQAGAPHKKNAKKVYQNCSKHAQTQVRTNKCVQSFSERQQFHLWGVVSVIFVNPFNLIHPLLQKLHLTLFLESLTLNYTYSQNWTPCSSRYLWPRVGGAKGDVPEVGGGGQRRPNHPDQVARHHRHQRLPQRWQLQGEQEALRDGSVRGRRHLRTNQVFVANNYWSSVACQMCF